MTRPRHRIAPTWILVLIGFAADAAHAQDAVIRVRADRPGPAATRHMTGACIEDVNHEIYGGISSQMVFGESFQEPPAAPVAGFAAFGGVWSVAGDVVRRGRRRRPGRGRHGGRRRPNPGPPGGK